MGYVGKVGFCIGEDFKRETDPKIFERMKRIGTPALSDGMNRFNTLDPEIKPIINGCCIAGQAFTLRLRAADNLMLHKSLGLLKKGDVLMVDTCGCKNYSILGELIATAAFKQEIAGIVIDGGIRDICELREAGFPVFTRFITPAVGDKDGPGEINRLISCGGVPVAPGDYVLADDNGIVVVPKDLLNEVLAAGEKKRESDQKRMEEIEAGVIVKPVTDEILRKKGIITGNSMKGEEGQK